MALASVKLSLEFTYLFFHLFQALVRGNALRKWINIYHKETFYLCMYLHVYYLVRPSAFLLRVRPKICLRKKRKNNYFNILRYDIRDSSFHTVPVRVNWTQVLLILCILKFEFAWIAVCNFTSPRRSSKNCRYPCIVTNSTQSSISR